MRYTTDDMRNWAGPLDKSALSIGGENLAMKEAADEIDHLRDALRCYAVKLIVAPATSGRLFNWHCCMCDNDWPPNETAAHATGCLLSSSAEGAAPPTPEPPKG